MCECDFFKVWLCTIEDPLLVREDSNILSKRLGKSNGHLICFPVLMETERKSRDREHSQKFYLVLGDDQKQ